MPKLLALDVGEKRVGYAITDENQTMAFPRTSLPRHPTHKFIAAIKEIVTSEKVTQIIIGLPLSQENEETPQAARIRKCGDALQEAMAHIEIIYIDEASSTDEALSKIPFRADRQKKGGYVDAVSAQIILERYLDQ